MTTTLPTLPPEHDWIEVEHSDPQRWSCRECEATYTVIFTLGKPLSENWDCLPIDDKHGATGVLAVCLIGLCFLTVLGIMSLS
jgi:hypothetical protein